MRVLLTGGNGFIGRYVLKYLIERGIDVNVILRIPAAAVSPQCNKINYFTGDITNEHLVRKAAESCDVIIHLAALVRSSAQNPSDYSRINFNGTANLLKASEELKIRRFVFTSSLSCYADNGGEFLSETSLLKPHRYFCSYSESKARAEELVIQYAGSGIDYIIIYPTRVFGTGPLSDSNAATKAIALYLQNKLPFLIEKGHQYSNWAYVEDVANGIVQCALGDTVNEKFIFGGENKTLKEVYDLTDMLTGKKHLRMNITMNTALNIASIIELQAKLLNTRPLITREWLMFVLESRKITCNKAMQKVNYKITPFNKALGKTLAQLMGQDRNIKVSSFPYD